MDFICIAVLCDVSIASCSSAGVKGWLYFSILLDLKLSFCFSALFLKVKKYRLELLIEEFAKNVSSNVCYIFLASWFRFVFCEVSESSWLVFPDIFLIIVQIVFVLAEEANWLT